MAFVLLSAKEKFSANSSLSLKFFNFCSRALSSFSLDPSQSLPTLNKSYPIKLPQVIPSGSSNLEKGFRIDLVNNDLWGVSLSPMKPFNLVGSSSDISDDYFGCSQVGLAEESLDVDEIEDLRLHKRLFYKLDKGSKEFEEYNFGFHQKKSARKSDKRATKAVSSRECKQLDKQKLKANKPIVPKDLKRELDESLSKFDNVTKSAMMDGKRVRIPTFNQLTNPYHLPFCLDIYVSKGSVRACIVHRITSKVVAVAHSISKDMKFELRSRKDTIACASVGAVLAQRAIEDDIHNVIYTPRKGERIDGKIQIILQSIIDHGVDVKVKLKQKQMGKRSIRCKQV